MQRRLAIATALMLLINSAFIVAYAVLTPMVTVPTDGTVTVPKVSVTPTSIQWGTFTVNTSIIQPLEVTNIGEVPVKALHMTYDLPINFTGTLTWDLEGVTLDVAQARITSLNLTLTEASEGPFNFNITIYGET